MMNTFIETVKYFFVISAELILLFMLISMIVELILMYIPADKIQSYQSGKGLKGNFLGALIGSLTPFCACSTIPMTLGFINSGIPFGSTISFLIASPLLNPIIIGMLGVMLGVKAAVIYFVITFLCSVFFGYFMDKTGGVRYLKNQYKKVVSCGCGDDEETSTKPRKLTFKKKITLAFQGAWGSMKPILGYLFIGVAVGALIYGYLPEDFVVRMAGANNPFAVPVAAIIGIPLYIRAETAIPIGLALMQKGMSIGAVVALIIGGAGMAIPEMSMLAGIFKKKMVIMIIAVIFLTAVISGWLFNLFY